MSNRLEKDQSVKHIDWEKEEFASLDKKRPTIPEKVAEYIDSHKKDFSTLFRAFDKANNYVRELYVIKAPLVWDETDDVFFKHDDGSIASWVL